MSDTARIRLVGPGWTAFTGYFGQVPFEDGLSTRVCSRNEIDHLAAITRIETEDGEDVGAAVRLVGGATKPAEVVEPLARQSETEKLVEATRSLPAEALVSYTADDLAQIADEKGIKGLREIATPRGLKGRAIPELIAEILREQSERAKKDVPEEPVAEANQADQAPEVAEPPGGAPSEAA